MSAKLEDRVVIVVGGGQAAGQTTGNGRAASIVYARNGAKVIVADKDDAAAEQTVKLIQNEGGQAHAHTADVTVEDDCAGIAEATLSRYGRIDVLHNNVGIPVEGTTEELPPGQWRTGLEVNLTGMWLTCKHVLPHLREQHSGVVINISSLASELALGNLINYATTKAAINSMTRSLAFEYAPHRVRVNCITPGLVDTPMSIDVNARKRGTTREEVLAERRAMVPLAHPGTAWDIANAALFLASDDAAFITGAVLPVDGGSSLFDGQR